VDLASRRAAVSRPERAAKQTMPTCAHAPSCSRWRRRTRAQQLPQAQRGDDGEHVQRGLVEGGGRKARSVNSRAQCTAATPAATVESDKMRRMLTAVPK